MQTQTLLFQLPLENITQPLNITIESALCDTSGENCGTAWPADVPAVVKLTCANAGAQGFSTVTDIVANSQTLIITPTSPSWEPSEALRCAVIAEDYLPGPVLVNVTATVLQNGSLPALVESEQAAARQIFDTCCSGGNCSAWDAAAEAAGLDFAAGDVLTDLCLLEGNRCTPEGNLVTLNLVGYGLSCSLESLNFSNFTQLENLFLTGNVLTVGLSVYLHRH